MSKRKNRAAHIHSVVERVERRLLMATNSWKNPISGDWDTASNWSLGHVPMASEDVVIPATGNYTVTHSTTDLDSVLSLTADEPLTISGGEIEVFGGGVTVNNTTITLSASTNTATLLFDSDTQAETIGGSGTIDLAGSTPGNDSITTVNTDPITIASGISIVGGGNLTADLSNLAYINQGTIDANVSGETMSVHGFVENESTEEATNGGSLDITETDYTNNADGTISITGGGTLTIGDSQSETGSNAGTITETNSTLNLGDTFTNTGTISRSGGTVNLTGIFNLSGGSFTLTTALGQWFMVGGGFENGTLSFSGNGLLTPTSTQGVFTSLTLASNFTIPDNSYIQVNNGLTLNDVTITFASAGSTSELNFDAISAPVTLGGSGTIDFAGTFPSHDEIIVTNENTLTITAGITIEGGGEIVAGFSGDPAFINQGTINANVSGETLTVQGRVENEATEEATNGGSLDITETNYTNDADGTISITGGGTLTVGDNLGDAGSNAGTISENNSTLNLGTIFTNTGSITRTGGTVNLTGVYNLNSGAFTITSALGQWFMLGGGFENGRLSFSGTGTLTPTSTAGSLSNMTLASNLIIPSSADVVVTNNLVLNAKIRLKGATSPARLNFNETTVAQTLSGGGQIVFAGTYTSADEMLSDNEDGTLTIGAGITVEGVDGYINSNFNQPGIINDGIISANVAAGTLTVNPEGFTNNGVLEAAPGTLEISGTYDESGGTMTVGIGGTVAGTSYGQIVCSGSLTLGGTFNSPLLANFTPTAGQVFTAITDSGQGGNFAQAYTQVGGGDGFNLSTGASTVSLEATTSDEDFADLSAGLLTINGTNNADTITLNQPADIIKTTMNGTSDVFFANRISDELVNGNAGNDSIISHIANDTLIGYAGDDTIVGMGGHSTLQGAGGNDSITGSGGNDSLRGGGFNDSLTGSGGNNIIVGGGGNDTIMGGSGQNTLAGGPGNDSIISGAATDSMISGIGVDTLDATNGTNDTLMYNAGDSLIGVVAGDSLIGPTT